MVVSLFVFLKLVLFTYVINKEKLFHIILAVIPAFLLSIFSFVGLSVMYHLVLYIIVVFVSLFNVVDNKSQVLLYTLYFMFIDIFSYFVVFGYYTIFAFSISFSGGEVVSIYKIVLANLIWLVVLFGYSKLHTFNKLKNNSIELLLALTYFFIIIITTVIHDLNVSATIKQNTNNIVFFNFVFAHSLFLIGVLYSTLTIELSKEQDVYLTSIFEKENRLSILSNNDENSIIKEINNLITSKQYQKAKEYTDRLLKTNITHKKTLYNLSKIDNEPILNLIKLKLGLFNQINLSLNIESSLKNVSLEAEMYLLEILGILIDNALEASVKSPERFLSISTFTDDGVDVIKIENSSTQKDLYYLKKKISDKGEQDRLNGLKILDILVGKSHSTLIKEVDDIVSFTLFL